MERYDIAIIGTGPAGLEAAITATIRNKRVILLGSKDLSRKLIKAHEIQNYLGFPAVKGEDLALAFQRHLDQLGIGITEERVSAVYAMGDYYALQAGEKMIEATCVILATGVVQGKPLPGEEEALGHGVSYCATCDAALVRGKKVAVVGFSAKEEAEAAFLSEICPEVLYFPDVRGNRKPAGEREGDSGEGRRTGENGGRNASEDRRGRVSRARGLRPARRGGPRSAGAGAGNGRPPCQGEPQHGEQSARPFRLRGYRRPPLSVHQGGGGGQYCGSERGQLPERRQIKQRRNGSGDNPGPAGKQKERRKRTWSER